eukprot:1136688-Pelagomonas_calceolata.AAC.11
MGWTRSAAVHSSCAAWGLGMCVSSIACCQSCVGANQAQMPNRVVTRDRRSTQRCSRGSTGLWITVTVQQGQRGATDHSNGAAGAALGAGLVLGEYVTSESVMTPPA